MENASKALIMAAGVLLGIMILSLLVYTFAQAGDFYRSQNKLQSDKQLQQFNTQFEAYNKNGLYATDIATLINKAKENNERYEVNKNASGQYINDNEYYIGIIFLVNPTGTDGRQASYYISNGTAEEFIANFNGYKFKCSGNASGTASGITYHHGGRVATLTFITE